MDNLFSLQNIENNLKGTINTIDNSLKSMQAQFFQSEVGKIVDNALNVGIKAICPNFIEDEVIELKDSLLKGGFNESIDYLSNKFSSVSNNLSAIATGDFESLSQIKEILKDTGVLKDISSLLDVAIEFSKEKGFIDKDLAKLIKKEKNSILNAVTNNLESKLDDQIKSLEKLEKYCSNWEVAFNNKDFSKMDVEYKKIQKIMKDLVPLKNALNKTEEIENVQNLIKKNGENFDFSDTKLELINVLK